jgi:hypothetical protein
MKEPINPVVVTQSRYDELLRKEAMFDAIERLHKKTTSYSFHDVVGFLINSDAEFQPKVKADE